MHFSFNREVVYVLYYFLVLQLIALCSVPKHSQVVQSAPESRPAPAELTMTGGALLLTQLPANKGKNKADKLQVRTPKH